MKNKIPMALRLIAAIPYLAIITFFCWEYDQGKFFGTAGVIVTITAMYWVISGKFTYLFSAIIALLSLGVWFFSAIEIYSHFLHDKIENGEASFFGIKSGILIFFWSVTELTGHYLHYNSKKNEKSGTKNQEG